MGNAYFKQLSQIFARFETEFTSLHIILQFDYLYTDSTKLLSMAVSPRQNRYEQALAKYQKVDGVCQDLSILEFLRVQVAES